MSQQQPQAGPSNPTQTNQPGQQSSVQAQQQALAAQISQLSAPSQAGGFDPQAQQQLLQQLAQRMPGNAGASNSNNTINFPSLGNLQLPPTRKQSGGEPSTAANTGSPASASSGNADLSTLHAQLQARMLQAQQQARQAAALRASQGNNANSSTPDASGQTGQQSSGTNATVPPKPPNANGLPDWAAAAAASGLLSNVQGGDREAIMKQVSPEY